MVAGEEEKSENGNRDCQSTPDIDCQTQYLHRKLCRLEKMLSQKERCHVDTEVTLEGEKGATHAIPLDEGARNEEASRKQIQDIEYSTQNYMSQIADFEQKLMRGENFSKQDYFKHAEKKLSILELYRNLQMLEKRYFYEESENDRKIFQNNVGAKCETKNHFCVGHLSNKKGRKELISANTCNKNPKCNSSAVCSCDEFMNNARLKNDKSKLNVPIETIKRQAPFVQATCFCHEMSSSSGDSEDSFYKCLHLPKNKLSKSCHYKEEDVESESSSEDQTTCSEVSKCTCYCSKDHSHDESSEAGSDYDVCQEKKAKPERFRGGLDVISSKTRKIMEYDKKLNERKDYPVATNVPVDNIKLLKVEELREGLERLKIRNRNLRDFLDTLQNPIRLSGKPSETNTICTQVSSCYTFDVARQTRSGLLTVVEVLKGKCRSKDAVIVALADELKTGSDKKIDVLETEKQKILTQDKSLVWNSLMEEKNNGRKFTKRDSAIGFAVFLMILISHVKRSEMISYLSAVKKILTESPFKLSLFMNEAESFSIDFISAYYQDIVYSFQNFVTYSLDRWANVVLQFNHWFVSYDAYSKQYFDVVNTFLLVNQSWILPAVCAGLIGILVINIKKISANILNSIEECEKSYIFVRSFALNLTTFCRQISSSKIFWFTIGFCSQILWNSMQIDLYAFLESLKVYYSKNAEHSLFEELSRTDEIIDNDCMVFDKFDYSWLVSIFCNKFKSFVQFAHYIIKNI